jgi:hypothetical protein
VTFQALTEESMKVKALWDIVPCSLVGVDRRFRDACYLHHHPDDEGSTHLLNLVFSNETTSCYTSQKPLIFTVQLDVVWLFPVLFSAQKMLCSGSILHPRISIKWLNKSLFRNYKTTAQCPVIRIKTRTEGLQFTKLYSLHS